MTKFRQNRLTLKGRSVKETQTGRQTRLKIIWPFRFAIGPITERIEYKLISLTYKSSQVTTTQLQYLHHLISVQPPHSTRSSSLVTVARPPTSSSLRITDRSFRYASPCLWNQLPSSFRQPRFSPSVSVLPVHAPTTSSHSANSPLTIHNSLSLSLPPQDLPLSQIFPTIDSLPASGLTPRTSRPDRFF